MFLETQNLFSLEMYEMYGGICDRKYQSFLSKLVYKGKSCLEEL